jgi:hypothetical protein
LVASAQMNVNLILNYFFWLLAEGNKVDEIKGYAEILPNASVKSKESSQNKINRNTWDLFNSIKLLFYAHGCLTLWMFLRNIGKEFLWNLFKWVTLRRLLKSCYSILTAPIKQCSKF